MFAKWIRSSHNVCMNSTQKKRSKPKCIQLIFSWQKNTINIENDMKAFKWRCTKSKAIKWEILQNSAMNRRWFYTANRSFNIPRLLLSHVSLPLYVHVCMLFQDVLYSVLFSPPCKSPVAFHHFVSHFTFSSSDKLSITQANYKQIQNSWVS